MLGHILSADSTFQNLSILIDIDGIIAQTDSAENSSQQQFDSDSPVDSATHDHQASYSTRTPLFASNSIDLRLLFESYLRDRGDSSNAPVMIIYRSQDTSLPYDIKKKCRYRSLTLASLFPYFNVDVIRDLSPHSYDVIFEKTQSLRTKYSQPMSKSETASFILYALYGTDIDTVNTKEELVRFLIDLHISEEPLSSTLLHHLLSFFGGRFFPQDELEKFLSNSSHFFEWLSSRLDEFLHTLPSHDSASTELINFSHTDLSMKIYYLITNTYMSLPTLPKQLLDAELNPEDQWVLLLFPHSGHIAQNKDTYISQEDAEIAAQLEKLNSLADVDQESFLMKTRKTLESIVNDLLSGATKDVSSYTLFEKLKYLEDHNLLPKTTATFFHTIRKLGNLGAHEDNEIHLSASEIETILSMLSYVMRWHKSK